MKSVVLLAVVTALLAAGCSRGLESKEAVRQAVIESLAERGSLNLDSMEVQVVTVSFRQNAADATVSFRAKGVGGAPGMTVDYSLERRGGRWVVRSRSVKGAPPTAGADAPGGARLGPPSSGTSK